jgi:MFS family permease
VGIVSAIAILPCKNIKVISLSTNNNDLKINAHANFKKLSFLIIGLILFDICFSQMTVLFPLSIKHVNYNWESIYATLFAINAILVIFFQLPITRLTTIMGDVKSIYFGALLFAASFVVFSVSSASIGFYIAITLFTFAELIIMPLSYIWIDNIAPASKKGVYFGIYNLSFIGSALGPVIGGAGSQYFGFHSFYLMLAVIPIIMSICFLLAIKNQTLSILNKPLLLET